MVMNTVIYNPFYNSLEDFDNFLTSHKRKKQDVSKFSPSIDLYENNEGYVVRVSLAGAKKEDIKLNILDKQLTVSATINKDEKFKNYNCHSSESFIGSFSRSLTLPKDVNEEKVKASYENGVLIVELEKKERKKIQNISIC